MSRTAKLLIGALAFIVVVLLGGALAVKSMLSGAGKDKIIAALSGQLGVSLKVGSIDASLPRVLSMTPALSLGGIEIGNPPGFSNTPMVVAEAIDTRVELGSLFSGAPRIIALEILKPAVLIERNAAGRTNLQVLMDGLSKKSEGVQAGAAPKADAGGLAIEDLLIAGGSFQVAGEPKGAWGDINIKLNGFGTPRPLKAVASASMAGAQKVQIEFVGGAGPFVGAAMPVDGKLKISAAPGEKTRMELDVALKGDLSTVAKGPAKLVVTDYPVGANAQKMLPLSGQAEGTVTLKQALGAEAAFAVVIPKAALTLAGGQLNSRIELSSKASAVTGSVAGALGGLRIEQLLSAFSVANPGVEGGLTIPRFQLRFAGRNAGELTDSLTGDGSLSVDQGKLPKMDLLGAITSAIGRTGAMTTDGATQFAVLKTDFAVANQVVRLSNLQMEGAGLKVTGAGTVGMNKALNLKLNTVVGGRVAELLGARGSGDQPARANVPMDVTGTTENPKVMPNVRSMAGEAAKNYLGGALNKFLGGRKK
ncbi:MAG: hypothetical protein IPP47_31855 [Bryobacterales bacterium]|nr:hypothetical protein [Bryobacterales bacterium]